MKGKGKDIYSHVISIVSQKRVLFFALSLLASAFNYLFQLIMGRMLAVEAFGQYNSINAFISNMLNWFTPLTVTICRVIAEDAREVNRLKLRQLINGVLIIMFAIFALGVVFFNKAKGILGNSSASMWMLILATIGASALYSTVLAVIQGKEFFVLYGFLGLAIILIKLFVSIMLVGLGYGVGGCIMALFISNVSLVALSCAVLVKVKNVSSTVSGIDTRAKFSGAELLSLYGCTFVAGMIYSLFINGGDIMLLGQVVSENEVGVYSAVASLAKIPFYVISVIGVMILPDVASLKDNYRMIANKIRNAFVVVSMIVLGYAVVFCCFGKAIITLLYGNKYLEGVRYIVYLNIYVFIISCLSIVHSTLLGLGRIRIYTILMTTVLSLTIGCVLLLKPTVEVFVLSITGAGCLVVLCGFTIIINYIKRIRQENE